MNAHFAAHLALPSPKPPREVCPTCKREVTHHRFMTPDGLWLETYHCKEHGDVIPMRSVIVNAP